ncbi:MAG: L-2-amino-thiazoline-4-carboxylic acid hydrolase, partial [Clostridia bacterium]
MSKIKNQPRIKNALVVKVREQLEHRAMWLALLAEEAEMKGLDPVTYGREAIFKCGQMQGRKLTGGTTSFKQLRKNLFTKPAQWMFEMKIKDCDDDKLSIDFHYCPLVAAWQKMGLDDETIARLCDTAMCGDRGIASQFGGVLNLNKVIAK